MSALPLVSCIMPTADRRAFFARAISLFLAQDYPNKQLVIVEDGDESCADLIPDITPVVAEETDAEPAGHLIVHVRLPGRASIGEKRNFACDLEYTRGDLIAHWDDDDWHSPQRLSVQVSAMKAAGARLCSLDRLVFYEAGGPCYCDRTTSARQRLQPCRGGVHPERAWLYQSVRRPWLAGGALVYEKALWREQPFQTVSNGEDTAFIDAAYRRRVPIAVLPDPSIYVAMIHSGNTVVKRRDSQWAGLPAETVRAWMNTDAKERAA